VISCISGQDSAHTTLPAPAPSTQYGTELHKAGDEQKFASSGNEVLSGMDCGQTVHILVAIPFKPTCH